MDVGGESTPMKPGKPIARRLQDIKKNKNSEKNKKMVILVRKGDSMTKQMAVETKIEDQILPITAHNQTSETREILPVARATPIRTQRMVCKLEKGIFIPNTYEMRNRREVLTTDQDNFKNNIKRKGDSQYTQVPSQQDENLI